MRPFSSTLPCAKASSTGSSFSFFVTASVSLVPAAQIAQGRRIGAGMDHARHVAGALDEALGKGARLVVMIPIKPFGQDQALRGLQPQAIHFRDCHQKARELLPALDDAEFRRLLDRVGGIET